MNRNRTISLVSMMAAVALFSACSASTSTTSETVAPTDSAAPDTSPATDPPTTLIPTSLAPTTTVAAGPFLRSDGLGAFDFGASYADVLAGMSLTVLSDEGLAYTTDLGDGTLLSTDGLYTYTYASGRTICWDDGVANYLCAYFGAADDASLALVGWDYYSIVGSPSAVGTKSSASGATINVLVSAVAGVPPIEGECFGYTNVEVDGILLDLQTTTGDSFGTYGDDGSYVLTVPAPAATVTYLQTGERPEPYSVDGEGEGDC